MGFGTAATTSTGVDAIETSTRSWGARPIASAEGSWAISSSPASVMTCTREIGA